MRVLSLTALVVFTTSCATAGAPGITGGADYQLDRLYLGRAIADTGTVSDSAFGVFLTDVVTPRFPSGFTTWRAQGQWRDSSGAVIHEQSILLELVHPRSVESETALTAIIDEYKRRFRQEAVLRVTSQVRTRY